MKCSEAEADTAGDKGTVHTVTPICRIKDLVFHSFCPSSLKSLPREPFMWCDSIPPNPPMGPSDPGPIGNYGRNEENDREDHAENNFTSVLRVSILILQLIFIFQQQYLLDLSSPFGFSSWTAHSSTSSSSCSPYSGSTSLMSEFFLLRYPPPESIHSNANERVSCLSSDSGNFSIQTWVALRSCWGPGLLGRILSVTG